MRRAVGVRVRVDVGMGLGMGARVRTRTCVWGSVCGGGGGGRGQRGWQFGPGIGNGSGIEYGPGLGTGASSLDALWGNPTTKERRSGPLKARAEPQPLPLEDCSGTGALLEAVLAWQTYAWQRPPSGPRDALERGAGGNPPAGRPACAQPLSP